MSDASSSSLADAAPAAASSRLRYRLLTGPDDHAFCQRVSDAIAEGYQLYGSPAITYDGATPIVAQALILPE